MDQAVRQGMSPEEFLTWEREQELRWEFDGFQPVAMTGGTDAHAGIQANLITALTLRLRGTGCRARGMATKVRSGRSYRYPDALVTCTRVANDVDVALDPVVLFEIISPGTARIDRVNKLEEYCSLASVHRYVLLEQDRVMLTMHVRAGSVWRVEELRGGDVLRMPEIGVEVPVLEFYMDLEFPDV